MSRSQTPRDCLKSRAGTSQKQKTDFMASGLTEMNHMNQTLTTNGHHDSVLARNVVENGYGSPPDKQGDAMMHNICRERPRTHEALMTEDLSLPKANGIRTESDTRNCETRTVKDPKSSGESDSNKAGYSQSEVTKIVPLKPQRSKKYLDKETKGLLNTHTQNCLDAGVCGTNADGHMARSRDVTNKTKTRAGDTAAQSATVNPEAYQQQTPLRPEKKKEMFAQEELREFRASTGHTQSTRGTMPLDDRFQSSSQFKEHLLSSSKFPTAPPRTLPLKTQWSRDGQSNTDSSHIHCRTTSREAAKRKQAVNSAPPPPTVCPCSESETLHELQATPCRPCFYHLKTNDHAYSRTHVAVFEKAKVHIPSHRIIGPESFLLSVVPRRKA